MLSTVLVDDVLYAIPLYGNCSLLVYNRGLLRRHRESFPENIREMVDEGGNIKGELDWETIYEEQGFYAGGVK